MTSILEQKFVHDVYDTIAQHFHITRGYLWNKVKLFTQAIPEISLVADIGCGNGKNSVGSKYFPIVSDVSHQFLKICLEQGLEPSCCNTISIPYRSNLFDFTLCVAVLHHLSSKERRLRALQELVRITKPGGDIFVQVWAFEQPKKSKKKFTQQENYVQWHLQKRFTKDKKKDIVLKRYYYVFKEGELETLCEGCNVVVKESFYECGNWGVILTVL